MSVRHRELCLATLLLSAVATDAYGAFPGENGLLTFTQIAPGHLAAQVAIVEPVENAEVTTLTSEGVNNADSYWSPDGSCITFYSDRDIGNTELYAMNAQGENQTRLTVYPAFDYSGVYTPDGAKLVFVSDRTGNYDIYTFDLANGAMKQLTNNPAADYIPAVSPDGTKIAFTSDRDGNYEIYAMDIDGSNQTRLTDDPATDAYSRWSPDGQTIAFATERSGTMGRDIWTMTANGDDEVALVTRAGSDTDPASRPTEP